MSGLDCREVREPLIRKLGEIQLNQHNGSGKHRGGSGADSEPEDVAREALKIAE